MKEEITNTVTQTVEVLLRDLASQLGTTTEYLWEVLVKQAPIDATINLIQCLSVFPFLFLFYKWYKWISNNKEKLYNNNELETLHYVGLYLVGLLLTICTVGSIIALPTVLSGYLNPEYWALNQLLEVLKGATK